MEIWSDCTGLNGSQRLKSWASSSGKEICATLTVMGIQWKVWAKEGHNPSAFLKGHFWLPTVCFNKIQVLVEFIVHAFMPITILYMYLHLSNLSI
jgi:hypothetical protein